MFRRKKSTKKRSKPIVREYAEIIILAVVLALFVRTFFIQAFKIPSESMEDTLLVGDFLFANKFVYGAKVPLIGRRLPPVRDPRPGDIVIFKNPADRKVDYIKRCVAVEGQSVELRGQKLFVDGVQQPEEYTKYIHRSRINRQYGPVVVPEGHIFVMGDNRDNSSDSREWGFVPLKNLVGRSMFIWWSYGPELNTERFFHWVE